MANSRSTIEDETKTAPGDLISGLKGFASEHGGATAVVEYVGRRGARIVLVGTDGVWGDEFAPATDVARSACRDAGIELVNTWERELMEKMGPSKDLWKSMGRHRLAR